MSKFCKDCVHYRPQLLMPAHLHKCAAVADPVTGAAGEFASLSRQYGPCGRSGDQFVPKPPRPWWRFW